MRAALVAVVMLACGKDQPADPGGPARVAPDPAPAVKADPASSPACKLVTEADAKALVGDRELGEIEVSVDAIGNQKCKYKHGKPYTLVDVILSKRGQVALDEAVRMQMFGTAPVEIAGVGTRALRSANAFQIGVFANGTYVYVMAATMDNAGPTPALAEALAKTIAGRL